jgi:hypothetical protein
MQLFQKIPDPAGEGSGMTLKLWSVQGISEESYYQLFLDYN